MGNDDLGVRHLGDTLRVYERGDLDSLRARREAAADQFDLDVGIEDHVLVLQAIPGGDLDDLSGSRDQRFPRFSCSRSKSRFGAGDPEGDVVHSRSVEMNVIRDRMIGPLAPVTMKRMFPDSSR